MYIHTTWQKQKQQYGTIPGSDLIDVLPSSPFLPSPIICYFIFFFLSYHFPWPTSTTKPVTAAYLVECISSTGADELLVRW